MEIKNIVVKKAYLKGNEEKVSWLTVGSLRILDDGKMFVDLNMFPDQSFYVFDKKEREGQEKPATQQQAPKDEWEN